MKSIAHLAARARHQRMIFDRSALSLGSGPVREDLRLRWLSTDPKAYDRMVEEEQMAAYFATIDAPRLAVCQGRVLELACGTGRLLRLLADQPKVQQVVGLDIAPRMLAAAAARDHRLLVSGLRRVLWLRCDLRCGKAHCPAGRSGAERPRN